jgi:hypothetical protein
VLYAIPSTAKVDKADTIVKTEDATKAYAITSAGIKLDFVLAAATYTVTNTAGVYSATVTADTGDGTGIKLGGYVNTKADWSDFAKVTDPKLVGVSALFELEKATAEEIGATPISGGGYKLITTGPLIVPVGFTGVGAVSLTDGGTLTVSKGTNVNETLDFSFAGDEVDTNYVYIGSSKQSAALISGFFVFDNASDKVGLKGAWSTPSTGVVTFKLVGDSSTVYTFEYDVQ